LESLKKNWALYLLHIGFVSIIATGIVFVIAGLFSYFTDPIKDGSDDLYIAIFVSPFISVIYGAFVTVPMGIASILIYKWLLKINKATAKSFALVGALFSLPIIWLHYLTLRSISDLNFLFVGLLIFTGLLTGYILFIFWSQYYWQKTSAT
jgi:hypothetical protein